jgi:hypothetical protein
MEKSMKRGYTVKQAREALRAKEQDGMDPKTQSALEDFYQASEEALDYMLKADSALRRAGNETGVGRLKRESKSAVQAITRAHASSYLLYKELSGGI